MSSPRTPSAWCKVNQGWVSTTSVSTNGTVTVEQVETSHTVFRLWKDGAAGSEYFLLENRQQVGYDQALPGSGLLLWHVDEAQSSNADENHYKVGLVQADGLRNLEQGDNRGDAGDPFPGSGHVTTVDGSTTPNTKSYAGVDTCVAVTAISASGAAMTADVRVSCKTVLKDVKDVKKEGKELAKEVRKEILKELRKDTIKDVKEAAKERKDLKDRYEYKAFDRPWDRYGSAPSAAPDDVLGEIAARLAALEEVVYGGAEPFIDSSLRPTLEGAPGADEAGGQLAARMADGDAMAKRGFDTSAR